MDFFEILGHLTYTLIFFSFLVSSILWLRTLAVIASIASIVYNYSVPAEPLWIPIQWNIVFILTNIAQISILLWDKREFKLFGHEKFMHENFFKDLTAGELKKLLRCGHLRTSENEEVLIEQASKVEALVMIYSGEVEVNFNGSTVKKLGKGHFIGEMSFLTNKASTAQIKTIGSIQYFFWGKQDLKNLVLKNPKLMNAIQSTLSNQLIQQILDDSQKDDFVTDSAA